MSDTFLGICLWTNTDKHLLCLADLAGQTYVAPSSSGSGSYCPHPSDVVLFAIEFTTNNKSRSGYNITSIEPADTENVVDEDLESLTRTYVAFQEKARQKLHERRKIWHKRERLDVIPSDYGQRKCKEMIQDKYGIKPLKSRWSED